ncbi:glycosyltransferase family 4 protein [Patescibacteria group bacterium]|nr:glycosyltransferase family 4 protein [Patescibacteria group bacterium]
MRNSKIKVCRVANTDIAVKFLLLNQLKFLKNRGYDVSVVCSDGGLIDDIKKNGIKIKIVNFNRGLNIFSHIVSLFKLYFYFKKEKFDIVHTHTPVPGLLGQLAAKMAGVPIIINTIHGFYFADSSNFLKRNFYAFIEKLSAKFSDSILSVSQGIIDTAIEEKICREDLLHYLGRDIDIDRFNPDKFSTDFILQKKKELGINPDKRVIGIVGRLVKEKGYLELFQAFKDVLKRFPNTSLLIIGPEESKKKDKINSNLIKILATKKNIFFLGQRTDVDELYALMDIFVLPSYREGIGASILEASAMGKPVISTNIPGCREAVDEKKTGILVPAKDSEKLAEAIIYLFENPEKAKQFGQAGREKIKREFSGNIVLDRIEKEYTRLIEEK